MYPGESGDGGRGRGVRVRGSVFHESQSPFLKSSGIGTPGGTPILDLMGMLIVIFRGSNCGSGNF